jgi:anti-sigma regulatory factor (Ser/Thr protein kinase)
MNDSVQKVDVIFEEVVKTTNDNRIKLIEDTIKYFNDNNLRVNVDHYEFYLVLDEAISNAMEHGNQWMVDKHVCLQIFRPYNEKIEICVKDDGTGFNPSKVSEKPGDIHSLSSRGRGIIIIKKFCNVSWNESGNEVRLFLTTAGFTGVKQ